MSAGVQLSVQVRGEMVRKGLQDLSNEDAPKIGRQQIRAVMERIKRRMQAYPPERPGQSIKIAHPTLGRVVKVLTYRRTGLLGASWRIDELPQNKGYRIVNTAERKGRYYAPYVVGDAYGNRQARMHKGRWQVLRDVTEEETAKLPQAISRDIVLAARRRGISQ